MNRVLATTEELADFQEEATVYVVEPVAVKHRPFYDGIKRVFDVLCSLIAGIILLIPMGIIAVAIKIDSKGPILYRQERLGLNGKQFTIYKFRSMGVDAEENGPQWADRVDDRCTRVGRVLRSCRMDELPQLWNIFRGDMSLVGPRPERPYFYDQFETYIHGFRYRLAVQPGLTGLAQVNGGYDLSPEEKIVYDMEYIQKRSIRMDLWCIIKTVGLVFTHKGAR